MLYDSKRTAAAAVAVFSSQTNAFTQDTSDLSQLPGSDNYVISNSEPI